MSEPRFDPIGALRTFTEHGVRFVLIGGYAAALRGSPMLTGDIDVCYARDNENLRALAVVPTYVVDSRDVGGRPPNAVWGLLEL